MRAEVFDPPRVRPTGADGVWRVGEHPDEVVVYLYRRVKGHGDVWQCDRCGGVLGTTRRVCRHIEQVWAHREGLR